MNTRGALIVIEGKDGAGKSTLAKKLSEKLNKQNINAVYRAFPARDNVLAPIIDNHLTGKEKLASDAMHAIFAADRLLTKSALLQQLDEGCVVVCDRYCPSGAAYSIAQDVPVEFALQCDQLMPVPDLVVYLEIPVDVALERIARRQLSETQQYEKKEFLQKLDAAFQQALSPYNAILRIDAKQEAKAVFDQVYDSVINFILA